MQYRKPIVLIAMVMLCLVSMLMANQHVEAQSTPASQIDPGAQSQQETPLMDQKLAKLKVEGKLAPTLQAAGTPYRSSINQPIVLIHGIKAGTSNGSTLGWDCNTYFDPGGHGVRDYLSRTHTIGNDTLPWRGSISSVGYYGSDYHCTEYLYNYQTYCTGYYAGQQNTNNENLAHLACELAWYIWFNYTQFGQNVQIVAHSMGGLIARWALYATPIAIDLPPYLYVQDVVTFDTPHGGVPPLFAGFACGGCVQGKQLQNNNAFMQTLYDHGQNPRGAGWGTDWTMMGQQCLADPVAYQWATYMAGGHKVAFGSLTGAAPCFNHGGFMQDWGPGNNTTPDASNGDKNDATEKYCDGCATAPNPWVDWNSGYHALRTMLYGLYYSNW